MNTSTAQKIATDFWAHLNNQEWEKAQSLLSPSFSADWPQSKEKITTPDNYININRIYPGQHVINILKSYSIPSTASDTHQVITEVFIESLIAEQQVKLFAISFFEIKNDKIISLKEYWSETYPAPEWRKHLTSIYT